MFKKQFFLAFLLLLFGSAAQTWEYFHFPQNNHIDKVVAKKGVIWVKTIAGDITKRDLNGQLMGTGSEDSLLVDPINTIYDSVLYYIRDGEEIKVPAPVSSGTIDYDSKGNVYTIASNALWKYDGVQWSYDLMIFPKDTLFHYIPTYSVSEYFFNIDAQDCLWGTAVIEGSMGYARENFWIDLTTKLTRYRPLLLRELEIPPIVDLNNNNKLLLNTTSDTLYIIENQNRYGVSQKIQLPDSISWWHFQIKEVVGNNMGSTIYFEGFGGKVASYDGKNWKLFDAVASKHYLSTNKDVESNAWSFQERMLLKNNGVKIDIISIEDANDTMNLCYQIAIRRGLTLEERSSAPSMYKDYMGNIWLYKDIYAESGNYTKVVVDPSNCDNQYDLSKERGSIKDAIGNVWRFQSTERPRGFVAPYTSDSIVIQRYDEDRFKTVYKYNDFTKPLLDMYLIDAAGNIWFAYGEDFFIEYGYKGVSIVRRGYHKRKLMKFNGQWTDYGNLDDYILDCAEGQNGTVWALGKTQLIKIGKYSQESYPLPTTFVSPIIVCDAKGVVWCAERSAGANYLYQFNGQGWTWYNVEKPYNNIYADNQQGIWTLNADGVSYTANGTDWRHYTSQNGLLENDILDMLIDGQGNKWFRSKKGISKLDAAPVLAVEDLQGTDIALFVYPNPAKDKIKIVGQEGDNHIFIYNLEGVLVEEKYDANEVDISTLSKGMYGLKVQDGNSVKTLTFIKD